MSDKIHAVIIVDSNLRDSDKANESDTNFYYRLTVPINFHKDMKRGRKQYYMRAENINLPISFYAINSVKANNVFTFDESTGQSDVTVSVPDGNYTIDELITEVQTQMNSGGDNTYTLTYDEITQKVNIASDGAGGDFSFDLTFSSGLLTLLGFDGTETITGASNVDGTYVAYTNTIKYVKLYIDNFNSNNVYDPSGVRKVFFKIPINETRNEFQFYSNNDGFKVKLNSMLAIKDFKVKLTDAEDNVLDLNGVPFSFDLAIYEYTRNEMSHFHHSH